jgi:hypothetical protein
MTDDSQPLDHGQQATPATQKTATKSMQTNIQEGQAFSVAGILEAVSS